MSETARVRDGGGAALQIGDRVCLSAEGKRLVWFPEGDKRWYREGEVIAGPKSATIQRFQRFAARAYRVRWEGVKIGRWHDEAELELA